MSYYDREDVEVSRDCPAVTIPYGSPVTIEKGCMATITQRLGGSFTVMVEGNLYRIEGSDADALGQEIPAEEVYVPEMPLSEKTIEEAAWVVLSEVYDPNSSRYRQLRLGLQMSRHQNGRRQIQHRDGYDVDRTRVWDGQPNCR